MHGGRIAGLVLALLLCGAAAQAEPTAEQQSLRTAWGAFCDRLKAAGDRILALDSGRPVDTAEGFQYLAMLSAMMIDRTQYHEVPERPVLSRTLDGYRKIGLDSSDNGYRMVRFEPGGTYRIHGVRGTSTYMGFQFNRGEAAVANLNHTQMQIDADGSFELVFGGPRRAGNWVELPAGSDSLYIREIFIDWTHERPSPMWIERMDEVAVAPPLDAATVAARLGRAADLVDEHIAKWDGYVSGLRKGRRNTLPEPRGTAAQGGTPDNLYSGGYFALAPDEALLIETEAVEARLWNVQLGNSWFQSLDYQYRQTSLNNAQAKVDADGRYRVVVAHRDPGIANWLDTAGHAEGVIYYRWNGASRAPAAPQVKVVKFAELEALLPKQTARLDATARKRVLEQRYRDVARRFAL